MDPLIVVLRLMHVLGGVLWVGSVAVAVFFIEPTAKAFGTTGERFLAHLVSRTWLIPMLVIAATVTIGAGAALYWVVSGGLRPEWITSPTGMVFTAGALAALAAYGIALVVLKPEFDRLASVFNAEPAEDGSGRASQVASAINETRVRRWSLIQISLLLFAVATMAVARYFR